MLLKKTAESQPPVITPIRAYQCQDCSAIKTEEGGPLYECGECGTLFNRSSSANGNHQCPNCNRFAQRIDDMSCAECEQFEIKEVWAVECDCCEELHAIAEI